MQVPERPTFAASSSEFALPNPSSSSSTPAQNEDTINLRFRRPSLLAPKAISSSDLRLQSPLANAPFTFPQGNLTRRRSLYSTDEDMASDSSPSGSSGVPTPPLGPPIDVQSESAVSARRRKRNLTPPRHSQTDNPDYVPTRRFSRATSHAVSQQSCFIRIYSEYNIFRSNNLEFLISSPNPVRKRMKLNQKRHSNA